LDDIISQARRLGVTDFFVSLHLPEFGNLDPFLNTLKDLHHKYGFIYHADISPLTLQLLGLEYAHMLSLAQYGIKGLRLDFGIDYNIVNCLSEQGFTVSVNASTINQDMMERIAGTDVWGWHNFYPRPCTGLSQKYFEAQNIYAKDWGITKLLAFIPGEQYLRPPVRLGLPTLEAHRSQNRYLSYLELSKKHDINTVGIAEGILEEENMRFIQTFHQHKVISIPVRLTDEAAPLLLEKKFKIRQEHTGYTWRLEDTRQLSAHPLPIFDSSKYADKLETGGVYMDSGVFDRYKGEIHIATTDMAVDTHMHKIGHIKDEYINIALLLDKSPVIQFV